MKKLISLLLAVIMVCSTLVTAFAMTATPTASPLEVEAGKDVTVNVTVDEAYTGLMALEARLYYDTELFTVKSSSSANKDVVVRADTLTDKDNGKGYIQIGLTSMTMTGAVSAGETIATVVFTAKEDVSENTKAKFSSKIFVGATASETISESSLKDIEVTVTPKPCDHNGTETETSYTFKETGKHTVTVTCKKCGEPVSTTEEACTPDEANPTYTSLHNGKHSKAVKCTKCGGAVSTAEEECTKGEDDKCAKCGYSFPEQTYTITVLVMPTTANVTFYADEDATTPLDSAMVSDDGIQGVAMNGPKYNYHVYTLTVPAGTYSYRGVDTSDSNRNLGGAGFQVTQDESITLVRANYYFDNNGVVNSLDDFTLELTHPFGLKNIVNGDKYFDASSSNKVTQATLLLAKGTGKTAYKKLVTFSDAIAKSYGKTQSSSNDIRANASSVQKFRIDTPLKSYEVIVPKGATVEFFKQTKNFNVTQYPESSITVVDNGDGTVSYCLPSTRGENGEITYRAYMDGKITKAGYLANWNTITKTTTITFAEDENPKSTENKTSNSTLAGRMESSTMVNVNSQNNLNLAVGETFKLRSYRAAWQIINTDTANYMIEPDFNYTVISGGEHISLAADTTRCTGNAGSGEKSNWMNITGVSTGVAILEVSYDAIEIVGGTDYTGTYGATDPKRTSLVVINVGGAENELVLKASGKDYTWDTEFDTVYSLEDTATFNFTATLGGEAPTAQLSTDKGKTWKNVTKNSDGSFTAEGLVEGNNILKITAGGKTAYQVVRAAKITYTVTNTTNPDNSVIQPGDKIRIKFSGIYTPVAKFSGIYNPAYPYGHKILYTVPEGITYNSSGAGQYNLVTNNAYTFTVDAAGTYTLSDGYFSFNVMGSVLGEHRKLTDDGVGANTNAESRDYIRAILPDITIVCVEHDGTVEYKWSSDYSTCTATRVCALHGVTETETVNTTCKKTDATCTTAGEEKYTAVFTTNDFGTQTKTVDILALGHKTTHHDAVKANCVSEGNIEYWECSTCKKKFFDEACKNEVTTVVTAKDEHNHKGEFELKNAKEATCTESGYTGDTYCKACEKLVESGKVSPVVPHKFGAWVIVKEPTKTSDGLKSHSCSVCGYEEKYGIPRLSDDSDPIHITIGSGKNNNEQNPETGAQVPSGFAALAVLTAAAVLVLKKRK